MSSRAAGEAGGLIWRQELFVSNGLIPTAAVVAGQGACRVARFERGDGR